MSRFRRLRRPVAVLVLALSLVVLVPPVPSRAAYGVAVQAVRLGVRGAIGLARTGSWSAARGSLRTAIGTFRSMSWSEKLMVVSGADIALDVGKKFWKWIKQHPYESASLGLDVASTTADLISALRAQGNDRLADAVEAALNGSSSGTSGKQVGDTFQSDCGGRWVRITQVDTGVYLGCQYTIPAEEKNCNVRYSWQGNYREFRPGYCGDERKELIYDRVYGEFIDPPAQPENPSLPDELSEAQAERLLNKIEEYLNTHKEQMEKELDDLLKKNIDDIDWPKFDVDEAKKALREAKRDDLVQQLEKAQQDLQEKQQQQNNCNENCNGNNNCNENCTGNNCCKTDCEESRLVTKIERIQDKIEKLDDDATKEVLDEGYDAPQVPELELKQIDFQPIVDVKGELMMKFPFKMLNLIPSAIDVLTAEPVAPFWEADLGDVGGKHRVDFAVLDSMAAFVRLVISWLCYIAAIFCCIKIWSRV